MNKKRNIILVIGFLSLVIFTMIIMVMMYIKNNDNAIASEKNIPAFVAVKNIAFGQKISLGDIELRSLPKEYVGEDSVSMSDIIDHYASVEIMKNDLIRSNKIGLNMPVPEEIVSDVNRSTDGNITRNTVLHDMISLPLSVFQNPDSTLHSGELIDIVGMFVHGQDKPQFSTRYIALHVTVGGFMKDGQKVSSIASVSVDEKTHAATKVFADEILLDMSPRDIGSFLNLYYKSQELNNDRAHNPNNLYQGHMWMVKCNSVGSTVDEAMKRRMMNIQMGAIKKPKLPVQPSFTRLPKLILAPERGIVSYEK